MKKSKLEMALGQLLKSVAGFISPAVHDVCRLWWYQPEEPEGFKEFVQNFRGNN